MSNFSFRGMTIPPHMLEALLRYVEQGVRPGHFLCAVLTNDLQEAVGRADDENMRIIPAYVAWLYNEAPSSCWGTQSKVDLWVERHANARERIAREGVE